ncbi:hypothetical protein E4T50_01317 [Aureobasidium sp. EXF-12298]|nr:hypothetical protein E4T50_01317 [Aureobasidium sp. EXF-12298]KAI4765570.1 hypothetical protein E4T51_01545 [Aureobasidium sp. EXF-12344]KAI4783422.1 hypothetical protein E4T52_01618 [Aureobasidium sp. EXF-3400]
MAGSKSAELPISLFDIFLGSGRTIRRPTGPPGTSGNTELVRVRPSRRASVQQQSGVDEPKPASAKGSNKEDAPSGSKHSSKKEDNKSSSKKDDSKSNSKPVSEKAASNNKAADADKAAEEPKTNGDKPQAGAQNPSGPVFTAEEDAKLLLLKSEGKQWGEIGAAIGKSKKQIKTRFHEIKPADWKPQKGGKHGIDKAGVTDEKNDHSDKQVAKMGKKENQVEERKSKSNAIDKDKNNKERALSAALLVAGKVEHEHAHAHRHEVHINHHHINGTQESRPHRSTQETHPRRHTKDTQRPRHEPEPHRQSHTSKPHRALPSMAPSSSRTAYTLATTPSLTEDDLFSFGELQALSELIGKDMQGMWQRVSAAFFGMTGRRIAAEDIRDKFEGLGE